MTLEFTGFVFSIFYQPTTPTLPGSSIIPRFGTLKMHQNTKITKFNILTSPEWSECRSTDFCMTLQASGFVFYKFRYPYTPYPPYILEFLCCRVSFCFKITDSNILGPPDSSRPASHFRSNPVASIRHPQCPVGRGVSGALFWAGWAVRAGYLRGRSEKSTIGWIS